MKIDVSDLLKHFGAELKVDRSEDFHLKDDNFAVSSPVNIKLKLVNTGRRTVLVTGTLNTKVRLCCCRCLKEYEQPLNIRLEEEYSKNAPEVRKQKKDEEIELKDKDFVFEISEDNMIDLGEAIRQSIIVALPIKPLCNKLCRGIEAASSKAKKSPDPRLAKLKLFKANASGGN